MKSTVVDESLSSYQPMYCSREYQASTRLIQQYEKSTLKDNMSPDTFIAFRQVYDSIQQYQQRSWSAAKIWQFLYVPM